MGNPVGWEHVVQTDPDDPDTMAPEDLIPVKLQEGMPQVRGNIGMVGQFLRTPAAPPVFIGISGVQGNTPGHEAFFQQLLHQDFHHFKKEEFPFFPGVVLEEHLAVADGPLRRAVAVDIGNGAGLPAMGMVDEILCVHPEFAVQQLFRQQGHSIEVIDSVFRKAPGDAGADIPDVRNGPVVPDRLLKSGLIEIGNVCRQVLGQDIHAHLGQEKVGPHAGGGADAGPFIDGIHGHPRDAGAVSSVECEVGGHIDEAFINGVGVHIFRGEQGKVGAVDIGGHIHVQFHVGQGHEIGKGRRNLVNPAPVPHALLFQRRTYGQAESAGAPGRVCHHQVRGKGIQSPGGALHGGIETFEVNAHVYPFFHKSSAFPS